MAEENKLLGIYELLLRRYGKQNWWPVRGSQNAELEICIGAILTQNTSWKNVEKAISNLNKNRLISIKKLSEIKKEKLAGLIKSSGYYNQKAVKIKNFVDFLIKNYNGNLNLFFKLDKNKLRNELLKINGIGKETADSIILYAAKKPIFVIDAYTKRVFERLFDLKFKDYDEWQNFFEKDLEISSSSSSKLFSPLCKGREGKKKANNPRKSGRGAKEKIKQQLFNEYHALIVEFGKNICKKKPLCESCVFKEDCSFLVRSRQVF